MQAGHLSAARARGFTFLELVVVIAVLGIVSVAIGKFMLPAITAQQDVERRAALVEAADSALRRMSRDIRVALPGSLRITNTIVGGSGFALEMIPTVDGARYCTTGVADCGALAASVLAIGVNDTTFDVLGCFRHSFVAGSGATAIYRLVVGDSTGTVYTATGTSAVITPVGRTVTPTLFPNTGTLTCGALSATPSSSNRHHLVLDANHNFPTVSPRQRLFVVLDSAAPVTYLCNATTGTLMRYEGYKVGAAYGAATPPNNGGAAPLSTATLQGRVADRVLACSVTSTDVLVQGTSVVTLSLTLSSSGETVQLMSQVQLDNSP